MDNSISDKDLEKVQGGNTDWELFSSKLLNELDSLEGIAPDDLKELIEAIKKKDWVGVAIKAIPLIAVNPTLLRIYLECTKQ